MEFDQAFEILLGHEGEYSDHPSDPGGATRWGVTERVARAAGYTGDMRAFPKDQAKTIYRAQYWDAVMADQLPASLRFDVFDAAVNSGAKQSARWLQAAVGTPVDGSIGAKTIAAARQAGPAAAARFNGARLQFMTELTGWSHFGKGWARRIASNLSRSA